MAAVERDEVELARHGWRLDALDAWRKEVDPWRVLVDVELRRIVTAKEIADEVTATLNQQRTLRLTVVQKAAAFVIGAVAVADGIRGLLA